MYCPYCNEKLKVNNGELYCKVGDSYFSKHIEKVFDEKIDNSIEAKVLISKFKNNEKGHFFCVNCGNKMKKINAFHEVCICCGFEINKSMYLEIVELNPHF